MKAHTARQLQALAAIEQHRSRFGCSPTYRELAELVGIKSTNCVNDHLHWLERKGLIDRGADGRARQMRLTMRGLAAISAFAAESAIEALDMSA